MKREMLVAVEEAFSTALQLPAEQRISFLNAAYPDQPDVRREVESLLHHHQAAVNLTQMSVLWAAAEMLTEDDEEFEPIGSVIAGKYLIRERLGAGGMAEVYLADHLVLNIRVALKRPKPALRSDPGFRKTFLEEAQRAVILDHDNVARIHDVVEDDDDMFVVMEYIQGETLRSRLSTMPLPFKLDEFLPIAIQCASALAAAHEKRIVHLDVKPENIMLTPGGQVKICDFGVARRLSSGASGAHTTMVATVPLVAGTPAYMAPEVILRHPFDERADIFSLGTVFYEMLTGSNPFASDTVIATTGRIASHAPLPMSASGREVDPKLERIVARMLAKDPDQRYARATDIIQDLTAIHRSRHRLEDITCNVREAFVESRWMKVAAALVVLVLITVPIARIYRGPIQQSLGFIQLPEKKTVVVLPFLVDGEKPSQHYAHGLTDVLTERLSRIPQIRVVSPVEVFESGITTPRQAFGLFGANLAITGAIHPDGDAFQMVVSVADGKEGKQLRARKLLIAGFNSLAIQTQVTDAVVGLLDIEIEPQRQATLRTHGTQSSNAYQSYLEGSGHLATWQPEDIDTAIGLFRDALAIDSNFSLAYAGLGNAYRSKFHVQSRDRQWIDRALGACDQAVSHDPNLAAGHICLGNVYNLRGENEAAVREFEVARVLDPNNDDVYRGLARSKEALNDLEPAEAIYHAAIKAKPDYWYNYMWLGNFYLTSRPQYEDAIKWYKEAVARAPDNASPYFGLCAAQFLAARYNDAVTTCLKSVSLRPTNLAYINLGVVYFDLGHYPLAANAFERARELNPRYYKPVGHLARTYYWMGKKAEATDLYAKAIELAKEELAINPGNAPVHIMLARYYAMLNNRADALFNLHIALQRHPMEPEYQCIAAVVYNQFGERAEAMRYLQNAIAFGYSITEIEAERELDNLREDPSFRALFAGQTGRR